MKSQRRFAPTGGELAPESVERFIGICTFGGVSRLSENSIFQEIITE